MKTTVELTNWGVSIYKNTIYLYGIADNHPRLGRNVYISHTSTIIEVRFGDNGDIEVETLNTIYKLNWKFVNLTDKVDERPLKVKNIQGAELLNRYSDFIAFRSGIVYEENEGDTPKSELELIEKSTALGQKELLERSIKEDEELIECAKKYEDCIYMKVTNISTGSKIAYNIGGETGVIKPYIHVGMFVDTILYMKESPGEFVDFRYYVGNASMKTYSWTENIKRAVIENLHEYNIAFNSDIIKPKEIKVYERKNTDEY